MQILKIKSIKKVDRTDRYDLTVNSTHNFFANGILIHNTSGISANVKIKHQIPGSWISRLFGKKKYIEEYHSFCTSRKVVQDPLLNSNVTGFYGGSDKEGRQRIHESLFGDLPKGMSVYYEILGYWPNGTPIQGNWDYGCTPSVISWVYGEQFKVQVYRITYTNVDGAVYEFSARQVQQYCNSHGWTPVEQLYYGYAKDLYPDLDVTNHWNENFLECLSKDKRFYMEMLSPTCIHKVPHEGIVVRNESLNIDVYKLKCFAFLNKEREQLDSGEVDIEELS